MKSAAALPEVMLSCNRCQTRWPTRAAARSSIACPSCGKRKMVTRSQRAPLPQAAAPVLPDVSRGRRPLVTPRPAGSSATRPLTGAAADPGPDYAVKLRKAGWSVSTSARPGQCSVVDDDGMCQRDGPHLLGYIPAPGQAGLTVLRACDYHRRALITPFPVPR